MPLKFTPMKPEDYPRIGQEVSATFDSDGYSVSVVNQEAFGSPDLNAASDRSVAIDHKRGYIRLKKPVVNYVIAQANADGLRRILNVKKELMQDVISMRVCYDKDSRTCIKADTAESISGTLWGAEVLRQWIDDFNIPAAIQECFDAAMSAYAKQTGLSGNGTFKRGGSGGYIAAGDWRFYPSTNENYEGFATFMGTDYFTTHRTRLSYLLNLQDHKERLYATITDYIAVLPLGMRPELGVGHDPLSTLYNNVIAANKNLNLFMNGQWDPKVFADAYKKLDNSVQFLTAATNPYNKKRKAIAEKLMSKTGHIRGKMLGKRVDFSGRSVITIDPFLSLRSVKIPKDIAPKIYRHHIFTSLSNPNPVDWSGMDKRDKCNTKLRESGILEDVPVVIGRQPTLHKHSMRAFQAELTNDRSIQINPLCVTGFNADFDGDQMWVRTPISPDAVTEVQELMGIEQNIYSPKTGECAVMPRQEIIYGLNVCTRENMKKGTSIKTYRNHKDLFNDLFQQGILVSDTVTLDGYTDCAGRVAFAACLPKSVLDTYGVVEITSKNIKQYVEEMVSRNIETAIDGLDMMVQLGFKISYLYPPTLNLLDDEDVSYEEELQKFHAALEIPTDNYERGLSEASEYEAEYDKAFDEVGKIVKETIFDRIGPESGFVRLAKSGARGSASNLTQMYGYKGRIQRTASESFKSVIEHSYTDQLTSLEHFVTAYGSRQGLINKSLNSADTGYAMRKMWHATHPYVITCQDCGTTEGIDIKKSDIAMFLDKPSEVDAVFCNIIAGRYKAGSNTYISKEEAAKICRSADSVTIRSVLCCKNPCCKLCYGDDPSTHKLAAIGLPVGLISAQSIGEPGTQLSMDSFKKGGVASKGGVISAFTKLDAYIECRNLSDNKNFTTYDPVAWATGEVIESYDSDGTKRVSIVGSRRSKKLPADALIRKHAVKGAGLCVERGDYDISELAEYAGIRAAQTYLLHTLYHIYKDECEISMKHFEVLVAAMTMYMVVSSDRDDLYPGQYHDGVHLFSGDLSNTIYVPVIKGIKTVPTSRTQTLSRVIMEYVKEGLSSSILLGLEDPMLYPLNRIAMGQMVYCGGTGDFMTERRM